LIITFLKQIYIANTEKSLSFGRIPCVKWLCGFNCMAMAIFQRQLSNSKSHAND
jgi:hypothetical protein